MKVVLQPEVSVGELVSGQPLRGLGWAGTSMEACLLAGRGAVAAGLWCGVGLSLGKGLVRERLGLSSEGTGYSLNLRTEVDHGVGVKIWALTTSHPLGWLL